MCFLSSFYLDTSVFLRSLMAITIDGPLFLSVVIPDIFLFSSSAWFIINLNNVFNCYLYNLKYRYNLLSGISTGPWINIYLANRILIKLGLSTGYMFINEKEKLKG